ncbi:unnamed protein product [Fusarium graminearum]|uniref:Uncharacterized protein n=1 Tax=Gibberella zeae TaxID=5518 RepID=A0A4E9EAW2_GIBZA|nr:unnamed protein product [Fusarium graminearum]
MGKKSLKIPYTYDFILYTVTGLNDFYTHLKNAFDVLYEEGQDGGPLMRTALKDVVDYIARKDGVWVAIRPDVVEASRAQFPYNKRQSVEDGRKYWTCHTSLHA